MKTREIIVKAIYDELKDKNATIDTIKLCIRMVLNSSGDGWTEDVFRSIFDELMIKLPFDPLEETF